MSVIRLLRTVQSVVRSLLRQQRFMVPFLQDPPVPEHHDAVAELAAAHSVGDIDRCLIPDQRVKILVDLRLRDRFAAMQIYVTAANICAAKVGTARHLPL